MRLEVLCRQRVEGAKRQRMPVKKHQKRAIVRLAGGAGWSGGRAGPSCGCGGLTVHQSRDRDRHRRLRRCLRRNRHKNRTIDAAFGLRYGTETSRKSQNPHLKRTEPLESGNRSSETIPLLRGTFVQTRYSRPARRTYVAPPPVVKRQTLATLSRLLAFALLTFFALLSLAGTASAQEPTTSPPTPPTPPTASATPTAPVPDNAVPPSAAISTTAAHASRASPSVRSILPARKSPPENRHRTAVGNWPWHRHLHLRDRCRHTSRRGSVCKPLSNARWWPAARTP